MTSFQTISWGNAEIRFLPRVLDEKKVREAARQVSSTFDNLPKDSFVALSQDGPQMVAVIPAKPKAKTFTALTQGISLQEAMKQVLEQAAIYLKSPA